MMITRIMPEHLTAAAVAACLAESALGHYSFTHVPSQIACDINAGEGPNWLAEPIVEGQPFDEWWMHGQRNCQKGNEKPFELPAGGTVDMVMSSRISKAPPPYGRGQFKPQNPDYVFSKSEWGSGPESKGNSLDGNHNIHAYRRDDTSGCALAIAYKSKAIDVKPEDFVIFTVVHDCPKRQRERVEVPKLPACPDGNCICAWFWIPKNSGLKNFYMTPFVCKVTGAVGNSPVDVTRAVPPRRCLDPINCGYNFGPRNPMYWLGSGSQINMPESTRQSPHYSIRYGFREGAQHDIFENTNPRRPRNRPTPATPKEKRCQNTPSRLTTTKTSFLLKSPNCRCSARLKKNRLKIKDGDDTVLNMNVAQFGPGVVRAEGTQYMGSRKYFPDSQGPFRIDLSNDCYLYLSDASGAILWESEFSSSKAREYIVETFTGQSNDPAVWNERFPTPTPTPPKPVVGCKKQYCNNWCGRPARWGCGVQSDGDYTCNCNSCTVGRGRQCNPDLQDDDDDEKKKCDSASWKETKELCGDDLPCRVLAKSRITPTCNEFCALQGLKCKDAWNDKSNSCTNFKPEPASCSTDMRAAFDTYDMVCECKPPS